MEQNIERRVKELIRLSLDSPDFRVSLVVMLLKEGMYREALEHSLPLIGTAHSPWFLYTRAWCYLAEGSVREAFQILGEAYRSLRASPRNWEPRGFSFTELGKPRVVAPFNAPLTYGNPEIEPEPDESGLLGFSAAIFREDWLALLRDIGSNIREYKMLFNSVRQNIELVLHHDVETVGAAVAAAELDDEVTAHGGSFLLMSLMSNQHLKVVADTLWRICADWNQPLALCEITSHLFYLLEEDETALELAEVGLREEPSSIICGNVRALILNRAGKVYMADEQWTETLALNPHSSATYLVLGHQALCAGGLDAALRYFQEAVMIGDNTSEANRFLTAALDCTEE